MDQPSWERISDAFHGALELPPAERPAYLDRACESAPAVRAEVEAMLAAEDSSPPLAIEERLAVESAPFPPLAAGTRLGPYRIDALVGQGGMGEVYRAERVDGAYRQTVAVKLLRPGYLTAETIRRFRTERQVLARLVHPGIAPIQDGGTAPDGRPYLVLQFVDGVPITVYCRERRLSVDARLRLFLRVAEAVQFAHGHLVVHRDLKPSNILVQEDGSPRLLDFGIAKLLDREADGVSAVATRPEARLLTPEHAAPEQLRGEPVTIATDVYGLGVLLYELLADRRPFTGGGRTPSELERLIIEAEPPAPSAVAGSGAVARVLRGDLDRIVLKALRKEPEHRYASVGQLAEDVERYLAGLPVRAQRPTLGYRVRKFAARNRALVGGTAAVVLVLAAFAVTTALQARRLAHERDVAERERAAAEAAVTTLSELVQRANPLMRPGGDTLRLAALLADAERWVDGLEGQTERQAQLLRVLGNTHAARGDYARAKALLARALGLHRASESPDSVQAAVEHELAKVVRDYDGVDAALPLLRESVSALRGALGDSHPEVAGALRDLAEATGEADRRRALLDSAEAIAAERTAANPIGRAAQLNASASERLSRGRAREAAVEYRASLAILEQHLPPGHPNRLTVTRNLVAALTRLGRFAEAEGLHRPVLEITMADTSETAPAANDREIAALLAAHVGRLAEAEDGLRAALGMFRRLLAPDHDRIANTLRNLGLVIAARDRVEEGLALLDSAVARAPASQGGSAGGVAYMTGQRVPLLLRLGRLDEADTAAAASWEAIDAASASDDAIRADALLWRGMVAFARETEQAVPLFEQATALLATRYPTGHPTLARARCALGAALVRAGRAADAARYSGACAAHARWGLADPLVVAWGRAVYGATG